MCCANAQEFLGIRREPGELFIVQPAMLIDVGAAGLGDQTKRNDSSNWDSTEGGRLVLHSECRSHQAPHVAYDSQ